MITRGKKESEAFLVLNPAFRSVSKKYDMLKKKLKIFLISLDFSALKWYSMLMLKQRVLITVAILSLGTAYGMAPKGLLSSDKPAQRSRRKAPKAITLGKINLPRQRQKKVRSIRRRRIVVHIRRSPARYVVPTIIVNRVNLKTRISQLRRGRTYISLDGNAIEKLGLQVIRDRRKGVQSVYLVKGDLVLHFTAKQATYQVNGKDHRIRGRSPYFYHGKLMVPFRSIAENLDLNIAWNNQSKEINVFV